MNLAFHTDTKNVSDSNRPCLKNHFDIFFCPQISTYPSGRNLMLDFEAEFAAFLNRDLPELGSQVRRRSSTTSLTSSRRTLELTPDGNVLASDLSYDTLVSNTLNVVYFHQHLEFAAPKRWSKYTTPQIMTRGLRFTKLNK